MPTILIKWPNWKYSFSPAETEGSCSRKDIAQQWVSQRTGRRGIWWPRHQFEDCCYPRKLVTRGGVLHDLSTAVRYTFLHWLQDISATAFCTFLHWLQHSAVVLHLLSLATRCFRNCYCNFQHPNRKVLTTLCYILLLVSKWTTVQAARSAPPGSPAPGPARDPHSWTVWTKIYKN